MNRSTILSFSVVAVGTGALLAGTAVSQVGPPKSYVALQPTTPGTSQSGHMNVSGTIRASQLVGGGAGLTSVNAAQVGGISPSALGTQGGNNVWTGNNSFGGANTFSGNGAGLTSVNADLLDGWDSTNFLQSIPNPLVVVGPSNVATISGTNTSTGAGVKGISLNPGSGYGGYFESQSYRGLYARGSGEGIHADSTNDVAVYGQGGTWGGYFKGGVSGLYGQGSTYGVYGTCSVAAGVRGIGGDMGGDFSSSGTYGVRGVSTQATGTAYGGAFYTSSTGGTAVHGDSVATSGVTFGVVGTVSSPNGYAAAFYGRTRLLGKVAINGEPNVNEFEVSSTNPAVEAAHIINYNGGGLRVDAGGSGTAVWALSSNGFAGVDARNANPTGLALYAHATGNSAVNFGVYGHTDSPTGYGVYSNGNFGASGTKAFRIDHPLDPENKYLLHYSSESPTPQNFYSGNATTDAQGKAWVQLPEYFASINANFKYQLTVLDDNESASFVQVKIGRKIAGTRFLIMTSAPNIEVSWRVEADRNDAWVQKHGAPVEVQKMGIEKGTYQHPDLYGQPKERGVNFRAATLSAASSKPKP